MKEGDTIAIISPSWGGPFLFPRVYERGLDVLKRAFGFLIKEFPSARMDPRVLYRQPDVRANDVNTAFSDSEVDGIICTIGGSDSIRILEHLDLACIKNNPKTIMGHSDSTTLLCYLNLHELVTYHGPSVMAGFAYAPCFQESMEEYKGVFSAHAPYMLSPFSTWGERYRAWGDENSPIEMESYFRDDIGHRWLNKGRAVSGMPWGGCIEILSMMNDTFAWPSPDFWNERILCIETSEDKPSPDQVAFVLRNFGIQGILSKIRGLLVARPKSYSAEEKEELNDAIVRVALQEFGCHDLNIVSNIDFGHTDPRHIIAFGIPMRIDPVAERLEYEEPLFS